MAAPTGSPPFFKLSSNNIGLFFFLHSSMNISCWNVVLGSFEKASYILGLDTFLKNPQVHHLSGYMFDLYNLLVF